MVAKMKRGAPRHPKTLALASILKTKRHSAVGLLEMLWHFAAEFAHEGDIGKFSDASIAAALDWDGASSILIDALIETGWVERCRCHRLRIHDWPDHADQTVERILKRKNKGFLECYDKTSIKLAQDCKNESAYGIGIGIGIGKDPLPVKVGGVGEGVRKHPTIEEVKLAADKCGLPDAEAEKAFNYWMSNGWRVGKNPMRSLPHALANWCKNWRERQFQNTNHEKNPRNNPRNDGVVGDLAENSRKTAEFVARQQTQIKLQHEAV